MKTIEIDNELILVEVPKDASDFYTLLSSNELVYKLSKKWVYTGIICKIIGIIETPNAELDFDVEDSLVENIGNNPLITGNAYPNYINKHQFFETKKESFKSRIQKAIQDIEIKGNLLLIKKLK